MACMEVFYSGFRKITDPNSTVKRVKKRIKFNEEIKFEKNNYFVSLNREKSSFSNLFPSPTPISQSCEARYSNNSKVINRSSVTCSQKKKSSHYQQHNLSILFFLKRNLFIFFVLFFLILNIKVEGLLLQSLGIFFVFCLRSNGASDRCSSQFLTERLFYEPINTLQSIKNDLNKNKQQSVLSEPSSLDSLEKPVYYNSDYLLKKSTQDSKETKVINNQSKAEKVLAQKKKKSFGIEFQVEAKNSENAFLVAVDDGTLHKISFDGSVEWSLFIAAKKKMKQKVKNTANFFNDQQQKSSDRDLTAIASRGSGKKTSRLVAGPDGYIFYYAEDSGIFPLQAHVKDIVFHSPFSTPLFPSVLFLGKKEAIVEHIDFATGERLNERVKTSNSTVLNLSQTKWIVQAVDSESLSELWTIEWIEISPIVSLGGKSPVSVHQEKKDLKLSDAVCEFQAKAFGDLLFELDPAVHLSNVCEARNDVTSTDKILPKIDETVNNSEMKPINNKYNLKVFKKDLLLKRHENKQAIASANPSFRFRFPGVVTAVHLLKSGIHGEKLLEPNLLQVYNYSNGLQTQKTTPSTAENSAKTDETQEKLISLFNDSAASGADLWPTERLTASKIELTAVSSKTVASARNPCWDISTYDDSLEYCAISCEGYFRQSNGRPTDQYVCPWSILTMNLLQLHQMILQHNESLPLVLLIHQEKVWSKMSFDSGRSKEFFALNKEKNKLYLIKELSLEETKPKKVLSVSKTVLVFTVLSWIFLISIFFGSHYLFFFTRELSPLLKQTLPSLFLQPSGTFILKELSRQKVRSVVNKRKNNKDNLIENHKSEYSLLNSFEDLIVFNTSSSLRRSIISRQRKRTNNHFGDYRCEECSSSSSSYNGSALEQIDSQKRLIKSFSIRNSTTQLSGIRPVNKQRYSLDLPSKTSSFEGSFYLSLSDVNSEYNFSRKTQILRNQTKKEIFRRHSVTQLKYARKLFFFERQRQKKQNAINPNFKKPTSFCGSKDLFYQQNVVQSDDYKFDLEQQRQKCATMPSYKLNAWVKQDEEQLFWSDTIYSPHLAPGTQASTEAPASSKDTNNIFSTKTNMNDKNNSNDNKISYDTNHYVTDATKTSYNENIYYNHINNSRIKTNDLFIRQNFYDKNSSSNYKTRISTNSGPCYQETIYPSTDPFLEKNNFKNQNVTLQKPPMPTTTEGNSEKVEKDNLPSTYKSYIVSLETRAESVTLPPPSVLTIIKDNKTNNNNEIISKANIDSDNINITKTNNENNNSHDNLTPNALLLPIFTKSKIPKDHNLANFVENGRFFRTFKDIRLIGKGGFGCVYQVSHRFETNCPQYAVKFITLHVRASENLSNGRYFREVSANRGLFSRQVVRYFTWWCEEPQFLPATSSECGKSSRLVLKQEETVDSSSTSIMFKKSSFQHRRQKRRKLLSFYLSSLYLRRSTLPIQISSFEKESSLCESQYQHENGNNATKTCEHTYYNKHEIKLGQQLVVPAMFNPFSKITYHHNLFSLQKQKHPHFKKNTQCFKNIKFCKNSESCYARQRKKSVHSNISIKLKNLYPEKFGLENTVKKAHSFPLENKHCRNNKDELNSTSNIFNGILGNIRKSNNCAEKPRKNSSKKRCKKKEVLPCFHTKSLLLQSSLKRTSSVAGYLQHDSNRGEDDEDYDTYSEEDFIIFRNSKDGPKNTIDNVTGGFDNSEKKICPARNNDAKKKTLSQKRESEQIFPITLLIQMELIGGMTLRQWLDRPQRSTRVQDLLKSFFDNRQEQAPIEISLFRQLIKGLRDIHKNGIVHRDIKPENIFVNENPLWLKIGDFGLVRFIEATSITNNDMLSSGQDLSSSKSRMLTNHVDSVVSVKGLVIGTPCYTAPEGGALCTEKADIYSAALIFLELLCPRFKTEMERLTILENFRTHQIVPRHVETDLKRWGALIKRMGALNPKQRPSAEAIYQNLKIRLSFAFYEGSSSSSSSLSNSLSPANCSNDQQRYLLHLSEKSMENFNQIIT